MKHRIITPKQYPLDQSCLFKLKSKTKLCSYLKIDEHSLMQLLDDNNYYTFYVNDSRLCEVPKYKLNGIHYRIASFLSRIEPPDYLYSGVKGRSNISNAKLHLNSREAYLVDIRKYFPSTSTKKVFSFFRYTLLCSEKVSNLLSNLLTYNGHIPTGSPVSMLLAYYSSLKMFEELYQLAKENNLLMSVFVDDITFSGAPITKWFRNTVINVIERHGYKVHPDKISYHQNNQTRIITGVSINPGDKTLDIKNILHKKLYDSFNELNDAKTEEEYLDRYDNIKGRLNYAARVNNVHESHRITLEGKKRLKK